MITGYTIYEDGLNGVAPEVPCLIFKGVRFDYSDRSRGYTIEQDIVLLVAANDPRSAVIDLKERLKQENLPEAFETAYPGKLFVRASGPLSPDDITGNYLAATITIKETF